MRFASGLVALLFIGGCGGSDDESAAPAPIVRGPIELGAPAAACATGDDAIDFDKHACIHAKSGPFASVTATDEASAPAVSKSHTAYNVTLSGSPPWVAYTAKTAGLYAFYASAEVRMAVRGGAGSQLPGACEGPTSGACEILPYVTQVRLGANEKVFVALYPQGGATSVQLVIEDVE